MLIIAIPKSASTSLLKTLGKLHKIPVEQSSFPQNPIPKEYKLIWRYHGDFRNIDDEKVGIFENERKFFKQHIPPTENNIRLLKHVKKVILLRKPEEIIKAYYRAEKKKIHKPRLEFNKLKNESDWLILAKKNGLYEDLKKYYDNWKVHNDEYSILFNYEEIINDPKDVINRIERFFNLPITEGNFKLAKERYSRNKIDIPLIKYCSKIIKYLKSSIEI